MKQNYLHNIINNGLLEKNGHVLDLGCGAGSDSLFLANLGYKVTSVDIKEQNFSHANIHLFKSNIDAFDIEKNKYCLVIAKNVLSFLPDKETVEKTLKAMLEGLDGKGAMYFTVFGEKDAWAGKENMTFFSIEEINEIVKKLPVNVFEKNYLEGIGKTMAGDMKFWHILSFVCTKRELADFIKK